jgi:hypothetical protein
MNPIPTLARAALMLMLLSRLAAGELASAPQSPPDFRIALGGKVGAAAETNIAPIDRAKDGKRIPKSPAMIAPGEDKGLVGHWRFDEGNGKAAMDSSKHGNAGVITGAKWAKGVVGTALDFNGANSFVNIPSPGKALPDKAVSVEAWIQATGNNVNASLVCAGPESLDFGIWIQGGNLQAGIWNSAGAQYSAISSCSPTPGRWHHVAMTCDFAAGGVLKLYIDGRLRRTNAVAGTGIRSGHTSIDIGGRTPNSWYFQGIIDELRIYSRALSEEEIWQPYDDYMKRKEEAIDTAGYRTSPWI